MSRWFRFYDEALNDPKVQRLAPDLFKVWINFLCLASKGDGLVMRKDVTFALRFTDENETDFFIGKLIEFALIEDRGDILVPHNWRKRQYKSDVSTARVKQFRKRRGNVSETPPDTEQSRAEQNRAEQNRAEQSRAEQKESVREKSKGEFEEFWKNYPKRKGSNRKSPAEKAFNSAVKSGTDPATIISAARKFATGEATNVGTPFIPMAATWLNQRGWEEHLPDPGEEARKLAMFRGAPNSPQFMAWKAHWQDTGKQVLVRLLDQRELEGRAFDFESQWPPGHKEAA